MSWQATAYVKELKACEDGAALTPEHKCLLFTLADYHQPDSRAAWRKREELASEALISVPTMKRYLAYLEEHCVIERRYPEKQGRGDFSRYVFLRIDDPERLYELLRKKDKGLTAEPLFAATRDEDKGLTGEPLLSAKGAHKGLKSEGKRGSEGAQNAMRNKEATATINTQPQHHNTAGVKKSAFASLPAPRIDALKAELAAIGKPNTTGWDVRKIACDERDRMFRAAIRAGVWEHIAIRLAEETYEAAMAEVMA